MDFEKLDCHFKWHPVDDDVETKLDLLILKKTTILDEYDDLKTFKINFIGYLHTRMTPPNHSKALEYFDSVLTETDETNANKGHNYITTANKIHTLKCIGDPDDEIEQLFKSLEELDSLPEEAKAVVHGHRGFTFSHFGKNNHLASVDAYKISIELDPENYLWPWGIAFSAGRMRRIKEGIQTSGNDVEETNLRKAIELSGEQNALPIVMLAELLFCNARYAAKDKSAASRATELFSMEEATELFEKAYKLSPHSPEVLKRCGKFYGVTGDEEKGKAMLKEACELNPYNPQLWFRLGQAYRFATIPDLAKAEECHVKAVTAGHRRHFYAEMHLGWIRNKRDHGYNLIEHFESMKFHYPDDDERLEILDSKIQDVKSFQSRRYGHSRGRRGRSSRR